MIKALRQECNVLITEAFCQVHPGEGESRRSDLHVVMMIETVQRAATPLVQRNAPYQDCREMGNTYTQIFLHIVFSVKGRQNLLSAEHKEELHKYITGIIRNQKQKLIIINSVRDHVYILLSMRPDAALSDLVRDIKSNSSAFINEKRWVRGLFRWQEGFGAFSCSRAEMNYVGRYIENQEEHHRKKTFKEEYIEILKEFEVDYDDKYLFEWIKPQATLD
jgi:putative transposase